MHVLIYAQGQTATLTANFTTPSGMAIDVPDATIQVIGPGGADVLSPTAMAKPAPTYTGFYFYDWAIPNSLPVDTYTVLITGTVQGIPNQSSTYLRVIAAGTPTPVSPSQRAIGMMDALDHYVGVVNAIPVYAQIARRNAGRDSFFFTWPRWNLGAQVRKNGEIISTGFTLDYDTGTATFTTPLHDTDKIEASYNWRYFSTGDKTQFLSDSMSQINIQAPGTSYTLDNVPDNYVGTLMLGATKNAMKKLIIDFSFQEPATIFGSPERAKDAIENFKSIKDNSEKEFAEEKKQVKRQRYVGLAAVSTPELTLPGGRCFAGALNYIHSKELGCISVFETYKAFSKGKALKVISDGPKGLLFSNIGCIWQSGIKRIFRLETTNGKVVEASAEHLFFSNGRYSPLATLKKRDELVSADGRADSVDKVTMTKHFDTMYDVEVPDTANLFTNDIKCHNSRWFRYLYSSSVS